MIETNFVGVELATMYGTGRAVYVESLTDKELDSGDYSYSAGFVVVHGKYHRVYRIIWD